LPIIRHFIDEKSRAKLKDKKKRQQRQKNGSKTKLKRLTHQTVRIRFTRISLTSSDCLFEYE